MLARFLGCIEEPFTVRLFLNYSISKTCLELHEWSPGVPGVRPMGGEKRGCRWAGSRTTWTGWSTAIPVTYLMLQSKSWLGHILEEELRREIKTAVQSWVRNSPPPTISCKELHQCNNLTAQSFCDLLGQNYHRSSASLCSAGAWGDETQRHSSLVINSQVNINIVHT